MASLSNCTLTSRTVGPKIYGSSFITDCTREFICEGWPGVVITVTCNGKRELYPWTRTITEAYKCWIPGSACAGGFSFTFNNTYTEPGADPGPYDTCVVEGEGGRAHCCPQGMLPILGGSY